MSNFCGYVKQISAGFYLQRTALEFKPTGGHIEKIDKTHYRVKSSGIVKLKRPNGRHPKRSQTNSEHRYA